MLADKCPKASLSIGERLGDFARGVDEKLRNRAERLTSTIFAKKALERFAKKDV
jgi:hypothetical protein